VRLEDDFAGDGSHAACLALVAPEETYDWEVRDALQGWRESTNGRSGAVGLAAGEKQMYRGVALAFNETLIADERPDDARFRSTLITGMAKTLA
jgi:hypothetical protein